MLVQNQSGLSINEIISKTAYRGKTTEKASYSVKYHKLSQTGKEAKKLQVYVGRDILHNI